MPRRNLTHLEVRVLHRRWSLNQRLASPRRTSPSSLSIKRSRRKGRTSFSERRARRKDETEASQTAIDAGSWDADWHSAKVREAGVAGNTDDLVRGSQGAERIPVVAAARCDLTRALSINECARTSHSQAVGEVEEKVANTRVLVTLAAGDIHLR